jgi:putative nucleotidyltransferase with HDIG domain
MIKESLAQESVTVSAAMQDDSIQQDPRVRFPIRTKITLPFVLLAVGLALAAAYIVSRIVFDTINERFTNDLIASGKLVVEGVVDHEDELIEQLRLYSHTVGVADAIEAKDTTKLYELSIGIAANNEDEFVEYLDNEGGLIFSLRHRWGSGDEAYDQIFATNIDYKEILFIQKVLHEEVDENGDKFVGLLQDDWSDLLAIAGPVKNRDGELSGVVLVGKTLPALLRQLFDANLAQITFYNKSGEPLASTLASPQNLPRPLEAAAVGSILVNQDSSSLERFLVPDRRLTVSNVTYGEILGPWEVRRGKDLGIIGIALPYSFLVYASLPTRIEVTGLVSLMILLVILVGIYIAGAITRPIKGLLFASSEVAHGNLNVQVEPKGHDEIAILSNSFNQMVASLDQSKKDLVQAYDGTLEGWSNALDLRDRETNGHTQRVTDMTLKLARIMGIDPTDLLTIRRGALLHDIGKMGVPDAILLKPGKLTAEEWEIMRKHPLFAYKMLWPIEYLRPSIDIPYCHHEHWDGSGYPRGLKDEEIPLVARIFCIADVWDAMRSDRPYRAALSEDQVCEYILSASGSHFDPQVVDAFFDLLAEQSRPE